MRISCKSLRDKEKKIENTTGRNLVIIVMWLISQIAFVFLSPLEILVLIKMEEKNEQLIRDRKRWREKLQGIKASPLESFEKIELEWKFIFNEWFQLLGENNVANDKHKSSYDKFEMRCSFFDQVKHPS